MTLPRILLGLAVPGLTARQQQIVGVMSETDSMADAAARLGMSPSSMSSRVRAIAARLGLAGPGELVDLARRNAVLDAVPYGIYGVDAEGICLFANRTAAEMFGYPLAELVGADLHELVHRDITDGTGMPKSECVCHATLRDGKTRSAEHETYVRGDGQVMWASNTVAAAWGDGGRVSGAVITIWDVSEAVVEAEAQEMSRLSLELTLEAGGAVTFQVDLDCGRVSVSENFERCFGLVPGTFDGSHKQFLSLIHPEDRPEMDLAEIRTLPAGTLVDREFRVQTPGGELRWFRARSCVVKCRPGRSDVLVGVAVDVTSQMEADRSRRALLDAMSDAFVGSDADGFITEWNRAAEDLFGIPAELAMGKEALTLLVPERYRSLQRRSIRGLTRQFRGTGISTAPIEMQLLGGDGAEISVEITFHVIPVGTGMGYRAIIRDIRARKTLEAALERNSSKDPMTGMPNRGFLIDHLQGRIDEIACSDTQVAVVVADVGWEYAMGILGARVGDAILVEAAQRIRHVAHPATVGRLGGGQFAVIWQRNPRHDPAELAERVHAALMRPLEIEGQRLQLTPKVGLTLATTSSEASEELLRDAATAAYQPTGPQQRTVQVFQPTMRAAVRERLDFQADFGHALSSEQIEVWYQPIISLSNNRLKGVEALARWRHPVKGLIPPARFVSLAESSGMAVELGQQVLPQACRQMVTWRQAGILHPDAVLSVNVSARQLTRPGAASSILDAIASTGLEPTALQLELTETALTDDAQAAAVAVKQIRELGVTVALDDFGTGYSSLTRLRNFPIQVLKLDQSFIAGIGKDPTDTTIVLSTIELAHKLELTTVAEGVETEQQADLLRTFGCDAGQGYLWAAPMTAADLEAFVARRGLASRIVA